MKKLRLAVIGQGRSGRDIHGLFYKRESNIWFDVAIVAEYDAARREMALREYPGCEVVEDYREIFDRKDIDLVVNASYSDTHYSITREFLEKGFNVVVEKPFARNYYECSDLMNLAEEKGVKLYVFQQSFLTPYYEQAKALMENGKIGDIKQVSIRYNGFARRWDWQTLQERLGGSVYNTGPHPIGIGLGFLDFSDDFHVEYSKLDLALTSGDAEDYAKIILTAPGKPVVDLEISSIDAYSDYNLKLQGTRGTYQSKTTSYKMKYIVDGENPEQPLIRETLRKEDDTPSYCSEKLIFHEEEAEFGGSPFTTAVDRFYQMVYENLVDGKEPILKTENAAKIIQVIETVHAQNPLPKKF